MPKHGFISRSLASCPIEPGRRPPVFFWDYFDLRGSFCRQIPHCWMRDTRSRSPWRSPSVDELSIFSAALELETSSERQRYLDEVCRDNTALRVKIDALLQSSRQADSFLEFPPVANLAAATLNRP